MEIKKLPPEVAISVDKGKDLFLVGDSVPMDLIALAKLLQLTRGALYLSLSGLSRREQIEWISEKKWLLDNGYKKKNRVFKRDGIWVIADMVARHVGITTYSALNRCKAWENLDISYQKLCEKKSAARIISEKNTNKHNKGNHAWQRMTRPEKVCHCVPGTLERKYLKDCGSTFYREGKTGIVSEHTTNHYHGKTY